jgi:CheY-like chemotaxis protein/HPt (histidine-containing phosphotransfer) domain-containing protein
MWVNSLEGKGSAFHFTARVGLSDRTGTEGDSVASEKLQNMPVLIVDDNATNRRILEEMLSTWGMKPTAADGGNSALTVMARAEQSGEGFPLVLVDAEMPEMDGFELIRRMKETPGFSGATIVMLTSTPESSGCREALGRELGVSAYLTKPIKPQELYDTIVGVLASADSDKDVVSPPAPKSDSPCRPECSLRILLVEDNLVNQKLAARLLEKWGYCVAIAANGKEALEALDQAGPENFDVVLMDIQMPEMNGFEATAAIREKEKQSGGHLPIVAMTAHAMVGDRERCLAAGMDDYVSKPVQSTELYQAIQNVLRKEISEGDDSDGDSPEVKVIDTAQILANLGGDAMLLAELAGLFLEECPRLLSDVRSAIVRGDAQALERAAHSLKGAVGNFQAHAVLEAALSLEEMGRAGDLTQAQETYDRLEGLIDQLKPTLSALAPDADES